MTRLPSRITQVALIFPLAVTVVGVVLQLTWLRDVPATIATHWNFAGEADGTGPAWTMPLLLAVTGLGIPALFGVIIARTLGTRGMTATQKILAVASPFATTIIAVATTGSIAIQRGITDLADVPDVAPLLAWGYGIALLLAVAAWFVLPRAVPGASGPARRAPVVSVRDGERVAWANSARFERGILAVLVVAVVLVAGLMIFVVALTGRWPFLAVPIVIAVGVLGTAAWRVRVDRDGLTVRGALGWPRYRVPLADVASAGVIDVAALGEFGGYGLRFGLGRRTGIITRSGEALEVQRRDGRALIVTVDDAGTAAGLLTALAATA